MASNTLGRNITLPIYNADGTSFHGLELKKFTFDTIVMALGDKITGELYYTTNTLMVAQTEYVVYEGVKYYLINPPTIVKEGMKADNGQAKGMTKYSFTFYHPMFMLNNFPFTDVAVTSNEQKYKSQDKTFYWIGNLVDYVAKLNKNLSGTEWVVEIGSNVPAQDKNKLSEVMQFDKQTMADAVKRGYDTWEIPYVIDNISSTDSRYAQGKRFLVRYGLPIQDILVNNEPYVFQMGQGVGLKNDSRTPKNNKIVTRIAGFGSEDNVPFGYPQIIWTGNQSWNYTINNSSSAANSYPIYDGIVAGQRVRLIHHPFTRSHLMPTIYADTVNKKVNPYATGYDPTIEIKDYYDAVNDGTWNYPNQIIQNAPSYEIHEFSDIKPELGNKYIGGASAFDGDAGKDYLTVQEGLDQIMDYVSETNIDVERQVLKAIYDKVNSGTSGSGSQEDVRYTFSYVVASDTNFTNVKLVSTNLNFTMEIHRTNSFPSAPWDDSMDDDGNYKQSYFNVILPSLGFDVYACAAVTQEMKINMRSGACLGCSFPVEVDWEDYKKNFYDSDGNFAPTGSQRDYTKYPDSTSSSITVICKKELETFGTLMPNIYQQPATNDKFVILGISLPTSYITSAQSRLDGEMKQYMFDNNVHYFEYPLKFDEYFLATHTDILSQMKPNILVRFNFAGTTHALYIKQLSVKYGEKPLPQYNITLTDDVEIVLSPIGKVTDEVSSLRVLLGGGGSGGGDVSLDMLSEYFLSKKDDDTAAGMIRFLRGLQVGENFVTGLLGEGGIFRVDDDGTTYIEADKLYIRMRAYFDTVEVKKYLHSGGNRIASKAGINCSRVEWIDANGDVTNVLEDTVKFRCYFRATGDDGHKITNDFVVNDLAFCKETNVDTTSVDQHGYWRCVIAVSSSPTQDGEHWIDLSKTDCLTGSDVPIAQDDIIQLGNKTDTTRQGAIVEFVGGEDAPAYQIYQGINSYSLVGKNYVRFGYDSQSGGAQAYIGNPDGSTYLWYHRVTEGGVTFPRLDIKANVKFTSPTTHQETTIEQFAGAVTDSIEDLQEQIDGEIDTWFYEGTPALNNAPASSWTTATEKERHLGDLYYDIGTGATGGFAYRFIKDENNVYQWQYLEDTAITEALAKAAEAYDLADHKRRVFYTTPTPPYDNGDLWVNAVWPASGASQGSTYNDDILRCVTSRAEGASFNISDWTLASNYTDDSALVDFVTNTYAHDLEDIETQVDAKAETWYQDSDPSLSTSTPHWTDADENHVGDIWYDTSANGGKKTKIWRDRGADHNPRFYWAEQAVPDAVFDEIDGKAAIYVTWNAWGQNLNDKDLFIPSADTTQDGVIYKANKVYRWDENSSVWREIAYTDDAVLNNFMNVTYANDKQNLQSQIDGKAETWRQTTNPANAWTTADEKAAHVGDLWMDISSNGGKKTYIYQNIGTSSSPVYDWVAQDVPDTVFDEIDGKSSIFVTQPSNYKANDLWILAADTTVNGVAYKQGEVLTATQDSETYNQAHWTKKVCYTDDATVNEIIGKYGQILNIQNPTAEGVGQAIGLLNGILKNSNTQIDGGLILTSAIYMKDTGSSPSIWAGISGVRQSTETGSAGKGWKGYGVAAWYGGGVSSSIPIDKECLTATEIADGWNGNTYHLRWARGLDRFDGSGYRADGNISWDASGNVTIQGTTINAATLTKDGSAVLVEGALDDYYTKTEADARYVTIDFFKRLFQAYSSENIIDANKVNPNDLTTTISNIKAMFGLWTESYLSALGLNSSGGSGSGLDEEAMWTALWNDTGTYGGRQINASHLTYVLGDYATKAWVQTQISGLVTTIPTATSSILGGIKVHNSVGQSVTVQATGNVNTRNYGVQNDSDGKAFVYVPWTDNDTTYSQATTENLGLLKVQNVMTSAVNLVTAASQDGRNYGIQIDSMGKFFVSVPWKWDTYVGATANADGTAGIVPAAVIADRSKYLRGDGTWAVPNNTTYSDFVGSGATAQHGLVPAPPTTAGTSKYLREDGTWVAPPNTTYNTMGGASASAAGTSGLVPTPAKGNQGLFLRGDATWATPTNTTYSSATTSALGLLKVSNKLNTSQNLTESAGTTANRFYGVQMDSNGVAFVNVPWTDTKDTAGSDSVPSAAKLYLIGASSRASSATTYSNLNCYIGETDNCLYSNGSKVLTSISSSDVTTALGFTPAASSDLSNYLPLSGGALTSTSNAVLILDSSANETGLQIKNNGTIKAWFGYYGSFAYMYNKQRSNYLKYNDDGTLTFEDNVVYHSGNCTIPSLTGYATETWVGNNYLSLSGGTLSGTSNILSLNSNSTNSYMYFKSTMSSTLAARAAIGYYSNFAFISNEQHSLKARIGVADDGTPQYWDDLYGTHKYTLYHSGNLSSSVITTALGYTPAASSDLANYLPLTGGTLKSTSNDVLVLNSTNSVETGIQIQRNGTVKAWFGYYDGFAYMYNATRRKYLKYNDTGTLTFEDYVVYHSGNCTIPSLTGYATESWVSSNYLSLGGGLLTECLRIKAVNNFNDFNEGIRIMDAPNKWAGITFGAEGNTGIIPVTGRTAWFAAKTNNDKFIISPNSSSDTVGLTLNSGGDLYWRNNVVYHNGNCTIPTKTSQLTNDSGFLTSASDTKNTAGSTDNTGNKLFIVGALQQAASAVTYTTSHIYISTAPALMTEVSSGWAYTRWKSSTEFWDVGTHDTAGHTYSVGGFGIRQDGDNNNGLYLKRNTSAYGKAVLQVPSGECSFGFSVGGYNKWTIGYTGSGNNFGWFYGDANQSGASGYGWKLTLSSAGSLSANGSITCHDLSITTASGFTGNASIGNDLNVGNNAFITGTACVSGNLGVGTDSPAYKMDVLGNAQFGGNTNDAYKVKIGSTSTSASISMNDGGGTSRAVLNLSTDSSSHVNGSIFYALRSLSGSSSYIYGDTVRIMTGTTERMNINTNGNVGIGVDNSGSGYKLQINGAVAGTSWTTLSDMRKKNYIEDESIELWQIVNAPIFKFTWKDVMLGTDLHVGSSAQYWQTIVPEAVTTDGLGNLGLQYDVVALLAAITTAKKVQDHENRIQTLERENAALRNELKQLRAA